MTEILFDTENQQNIYYQIVDGVITKFNMSDIDNVIGTNISFEEFNNVLAFRYDIDVFKYVIYINSVEYRFEMDKFIYRTRVPLFKTLKTKDELEALLSWLKL